MDSQVSLPSEKLIDPVCSTPDNRSILPISIIENHVDMPQQTNNEVHDESAHDSLLVSQTMENEVQSCDMKLPSSHSVLNENEVHGGIVSGLPVPMEEKGNNEMVKSINSSPFILSFQIKKEVEEDSKLSVSPQCMVKQEAADCVYNNNAIVQQEQLYRKTVGKVVAIPIPILQPHQVKKEVSEDRTDMVSDVTLKKVKELEYDVLNNNSFASNLLDNNGDQVGNVNSSTLSLLSLQHQHNSGMRSDTVCSSPSILLSKEIRQEVSNMPLGVDSFGDSSYDILVEFGNGRKKVFNACKKRDLENDFKAFVKMDPVLSTIMKDSLLVFQSYSHKFHTWVEIDQNECFHDGMTLRAEFISGAVGREKIVDRQNTEGIRYTHMSTSQKKIHDGDWRCSEVAGRSSQTGNFEEPQKRLRNERSDNYASRQKKTKKQNTTWPKYNSYKRQKQSSERDNVPRNFFTEVGDSQLNRNVIAFPSQQEREGSRAVLGRNYEQPELVVQLNLKNIEPDYFDPKEDWRRKQDTFEPENDSSF